MIQTHKYVQEPVAQFRVKEVVSKWKKPQKAQASWDNGSWNWGKAWQREETLFVFPAIVKIETEKDGQPMFQFFSKTI